MKKYVVQLIHWDFDTTEIVDAENSSKAKGIYINKYLKDFSCGYPKSIFFQSLRCKVYRNA